LRFIKLRQGNFDYAYVRDTERIMDDLKLRSSAPCSYKFEYFYSVKDFLAKRKNINISDIDKKFILKFDKEMKKLKFYFHISEDNRIKYRKEDKTGKSLFDSFFLEIKFFNGFISLELNTRTEQMLQNRDYFDNAPEYIKKLLANSYGGCAFSIEGNFCKKYKSKNRNKLVKEKKCKYMAIYTIESKEIIKCCGVTWFKFIPVISELSGYVKLIKDVYKYVDNKN